MPTITNTLEVGMNNELMVDARNPQMPFMKGVFIYAHRYTVAGGDYAAADDLVINIDGAYEVLYANFKEILAATNTNLNAVESDYSTGVGKTFTTAATNASSLAVEVFIIVKV